MPGSLSDSASALVEGVAKSPERLPCASPYLARVPQPVSQTTKRCEERLKMRLRMAAWLRPWLLDLKKVIRRHCVQPPRLSGAACQASLAWDPLVALVFNSR